MTIFNFFKKQFWKPTIKFFPRSLNQIFVGRAINNFLFWTFLIINIVWWVVNIEELQSTTNELTKNSEALLFGEYFQTAESTTQVFLITSFLTLLFSAIKIVFSITYYTYYNLKPVTVEESINTEEELLSNNNEFDQARERIEYNKTKNNKNSKRNNTQTKPKTKGSSLKKLK